VTQARDAVRIGLHLGLAHHPLCSEFRSDVVRVGRVHLCSGCLVAWPSFLLSLPFAILWRLDGAPAWPLLAVGLALGAPQLASYLRRGSRAERATAKALGGSGLALVFTGLLGLGWPGFWLVGALSVGGVASLALQAVRLRAMLATCDACPFRRQWESCPGFNAGTGAPSPGVDGPVSLVAV
jgi:hypothetical protein